MVDVLALRLGLSLGVHDEPMIHCVASMSVDHAYRY